MHVTELLFTEKYKMFMWVTLVR